MFVDFVLVEVLRQTLCVFYFGPITMTGLNCNS